VLKKILVPTDLSESSLAGIKYALYLASRVGAEVIVLHVVDSKNVSQPGTISPDARLFFETEGVPLETMGRYLIRSALETGRWELSNFLSSHLQPEMIQSTNLGKLVRLGEPADEIVETAKSENCDLIVMASAGKNWLMRLIGGSLTEKVVRLAPCAVMTIQPFARVRQDGERVPAGLLVLGESRV
jgi:nucleotide-binding universal stress UspA family protein